MKLKILIEEMEENRNVKIKQNENKIFPESRRNFKDFFSIIPSSFGTKGGKIFFFCQQQNNRARKMGEKTKKKID